MVSESTGLSDNSYVLSVEQILLQEKRRRRVSIEMNNLHWPMNPFVESFHRPLKGDSSDLNPYTESKLQIKNKPLHS